MQVRIKRNQWKVKEKRNILNKVESIKQNKNIKEENNSKPDKTKINILKI